MERNVSNNAKKLCCVWNSYKSVGYITDCKGGLEICDVIFQGVQISVTKHDEGREKGIFLQKLYEVIYGWPLALKLKLGLGTRFLKRVVLQITTTSEER